MTENFGRGWVLTGDEANAAGSIDSVGTFEDVLENLRVRSGSSRVGPAARGDGGTRMETIQISEITSGLTSCEEAGEAGQLAQCRTALQVSSLSYIFQ